MNGMDWNGMEFNQFETVGAVKEKHIEMYNS